MRRPVIHATPRGTHAFYARSLETGCQAIIVTTPYKLAANEKFSLKHWRVVRKRQRTRNQADSARASQSDG